LKNALILFWPNTGNTKKVAFALKDGFEAGGLNVLLMKITEAENIDYFDYDLVCIGNPSIQWHLPTQVTDFLLNKFEKYKKEEKIRTGAPTVPGKNALIFCTYSGPHTGLHEAIPVGNMLGSSLNTLVLPYWMNCMYSANFMAQ